MRKIMSELRELMTNPPEDIKLIPNEDDMTDIQAAIIGPGLLFDICSPRYRPIGSSICCFCCLFSVGTPYEGGLFRVKLKLGADFPRAPPKGWSMLSDIWNEMNRISF
jgi:ubiquitin-conjugating enzyme E2 S